MGLLLLFFFSLYLHFWSALLTARYTSRTKRLLFCRIQSVFSTQMMSIRFNWDSCFSCNSPGKKRIYNAVPSNSCERTLWNESEGKKAKKGIKMVRYWFVRLLQHRIGNIPQIFNFKLEHRNTNMSISIEIHVNCAKYYLG